jgi:hypothetical protein
MARILFGGGVAQIRGSIGGTTYSKNANGAYARNRSQPANRNTLAQQGVRNIFGSIARRWKELTLSQQASFIDLASSYPYVNSVGLSSVLTGFQLFQKVNSQLALVGSLQIDMMQPPVYVPSISDMVVVAVGALGDPITITATFDAAFKVPIGFVAVVEATREYSNGTYRPKSQDFKQIGVIATDTDVTAYNVATEYAGVFGSPSTIGSRVYIRIFLVSSLTGQVNLPQTSFNEVA